MRASQIASTFLVLFTSLSAYTFQGPIPTTETPESSALLPGKGWSSCLKALQFPKMNASTRELKTREESLKNLRHTLETYLTPNGQLDRELLKKQNSVVSYEISADGKTETLRVRDVLKDFTPSLHTPVDQIVQIQRNTSGEIVKIDVNNRVGGDDFLARTRRALGADEKQLFYTTLKFDPRAGNQADQCVVLESEGDVTFDYGYCQSLESIQNQQGACDIDCAKPILNEFRSPDLINPRDYDGMRLRAQANSDYRKLAQHLYMDLCTGVYANYKMKIEGVNSAAVVETSSKSGTQSTSAPGARSPSGVTPTAGH